MEENQQNQGANPYTNDPYSSNTANGPYASNTANGPYASNNTYMGGPQPAPQYGGDMGVIPPNPSGSALAMGIIGLVMAVIGGPFFGVIGGGIALVLGILAVCLGVSAKNKTNRKKGKGGFVMGIIAICFGLLMSVSFFVAGLGVRMAANERGLPLLAKHGMSLTFGVVGLMVSVGSEDELEALREELDSLSWTQGKIRFY